MGTRAEPRSRFDDPGPVKNFNESDLEICQLLTPALNARLPWGYRHLPTSYFAPLLGRGPANMPKRLAQLRGSPHYVQLSEQPNNLYRDLIYHLGPGGRDQIVASGLDRKSIITSSRPVPHELLACVIGASFEIGAREGSSALKLHAPIKLPIFPDWPIFTFKGYTVFVEADTGSMTINPHAESDGSSIRQKYEHYLQLLVAGTLDHSTIILFYTTNQHRCDSMIEALKFTIDKLRLDRDFAEHFGFTWIQYDRFLNYIPRLTPWAVTTPYLVAGGDPFQFVTERR